MSFIKRIVGPDERLIGLCTVHWIYGFKGLCWLGGSILAGGLLRYYLRQHFALPAIHVAGTYAFWTGLSIGSVLFFFYLLVMISTEVALTSKRIIYKRGLIAVDVREVDLEEIKAADVNNGWFGRFLNYGYLMLDARFIPNLQLPAVADPYRFVKALNEARTILRNVDLDRDLEGRNGHSARMQDRRYKALEETPLQEVQASIEPQRAGPVQKISGRKAARMMRPAAFDRMKLREKVKANFHLISHYGNKY